MRGFFWKITGWLAGAWAGLGFADAAAVPAMDGAECWTDEYNVVWTTPSRNSGESMPCGGGDIGLNVWVEDGDLLFYLSRSGAFDENNAFLKLGRVRVRLTPNPFTGPGFRQELTLRDGSVRIRGGEGRTETEVKVWVDVLRPVVHVDVKGKSETTAEVFYESWRYRDRLLRGQESNANSYKWAAPKGLATKADTVRFEGTNGVLFYHRNPAAPTMFDVVVKQQGMETVKDSLTNPLASLTFGGLMRGRGMRPAGITEGVYADTDYKAWALRSEKPSRRHEAEIFLHVNQTPDIAMWLKELDGIRAESDRMKPGEAERRTAEWWQRFWERSFVRINPGRGPEDEAWRVGRNYQLFRYMLGCNAYGDWPTKFNGGLFTYDPVHVDSSRRYTPDFRNWGGGTMTAQNQRLVYWPMLKSGDSDLMPAQFRFYDRALKNAEWRSRVYWGHEGACFTEQIENFGLPNPSEYGWKRPADYDPGMEYNAWLEYQWDTALEFCLMMLDAADYGGMDIRPYLSLVESCLTFFDEHYRWLASRRGNRVLDGNGHLVLYPGSGCETYKMAYNAASTVAALHTVASRLTQLPDSLLAPERKERWTKFLTTVPPVPLRTIEGKTTIAPAEVWARVNNVEAAQLYPVFPWRMYGIGRPGLDTARNTYFHDPDVLKFRSHVGWKQDNIFAACLGLTDEAKTLTLKKLADSGRRFPAFWGPGFDWTPDHNWGGSGMIGLQEMLLQTGGDEIYLFPAWPSDWDVHFRLHAPGGTVVEAESKEGRVTRLNVTPEARRPDAAVMLPGSGIGTEQAGK